MKKVLYISYDGMTDPLGQSQVLPYLKGLSAHGYEIHLVSFEKHDRFRQHKKHIQTICDSAGINWHPQDYSNEGGLRKTLKQVRKLKKVVTYLQDRHNFSIVHCRSYISALAGLMLKRKYGVKFIFDMRGFWADERVDGKLWNLDNRLYRIIYDYFKKKELQFFKEADYIISLTENGKNEINSWDALEKVQLPIQVIPCCVDLALFDSSKIENQNQLELKNKLGILKNDVILGYVGSIGTWYMLPEMLDFFKIFKANEPKAKFLFVTGEKRDSILNVAIEKGINEEDIITTTTLHSGVPLHISIFNLSIFFITPSYSKKASSPTKQGEIMAMGIPLICNEGVGDTSEIVKKYEAGLVIESFTQDSYQKVIPQLQNVNIRRMKEGAKEYFSLEEGVKRYLQVYEAVQK